MTNGPLRVLVVGLGHMGLSHARAYAHIPGFDLARVYAHSPGCEGRGVCPGGVARVALPPRLAGALRFTSFDEAIAAVNPDVVSIKTFPDTHAEFAIRAMAAA